MTMRFSFLPLLLSFVLASSVSAQEAEPPAGIAKEHGLWSAFQKGAWKTLEIRTETYREGKLQVVKKTTETTNLAEVTLGSVALEVASVTEVGGVSFKSNPPIISQLWEGEIVNGKRKVQKEPVEVIIEGKPVACKVITITSSTEEGKTVTDEVYYSDAVAPYILRRTRTVKSPKEKVLSKATMVVEALNMPFYVLNETISGALVKSVIENETGKTLEWAQVSLRVPGGIMARTSKKVGKDGELLQRSILRLVDYGTKPAPTGSPTM